MLRYLFLGRAYDKLNKPADAAKAYNKAHEIKPTDDQALLGLQILYEGQDSKSLDEYIEVSEKLALIYAHGYVVLSQV